jgi:amino acid transporter
MQIFNSIQLALFRLQSERLTNPALPAAEGTLEGVAENPLTPIITRVWRFTIMLGALLLIVYFIWAAYEWFTSGGDPEKLKNARSRMMNATIGLLLLVASFAIISLLQNLFGFDLLNIDWPTPGGGPEERVYETNPNIF